MTLGLRSPGFLGSLGVEATGGTITESDGYRYHTFTSSGTFTLLSPQAPVDYLVVGGGGGGRSHVMFGCCGFIQSPGGAGGQVQTGNTLIVADSYTVTVGSGGAGGPRIEGDGGAVCDVWTAPGTAGGSSSFAGITAAGGAANVGSGQNGTYVAFMDAYYGGYGGGNGTTAGGLGGGGNAGGGGCNETNNGDAGTNGLGGGGGGAGGQNTRPRGGAGGSGVVVVRYRL